MILLQNLKFKTLDILYYKSQLWFVFSSSVFNHVNTRLDDLQKKPP